MEIPDLSGEQKFPGSLDEIRRPSDEEVEGIPARMQEQIEDARKSRLGKISHSDPEMRKTVVGPVPDQDFLRTYVGYRLRSLEACGGIAQVSSAILEKVGTDPMRTKNPLRELLERITRMDAFWPDRIYLFGEPPGKEPMPVLNFQFPIPKSQDSFSGLDFPRQELAGYLNQFADALSWRIGVYYNDMNIIPDGESPQTTLANLSRTQRPGSVLAFAITR